MSWLSNFKLAQKLGLGFGICLALATISGIAAINGLSSLNEKSNLIVSQGLAETTAIGQVEPAVRDYRGDTIEYLLLTSNSDMTAMKDKIDATAATVDSDIAAYDNLATDATDRANLDELKTRWAALKAETPHLLAIGASNDANKENAELASSRPLMDAIAAQLDTMSSWNATHTALLAKQSTDTFQGARAVVVGLLLASIVFGILTALTLTKSIGVVVKGISEQLKSLDKVCVTNLSHAIGLMANGDLTGQVKTGTTLLRADAKDEFGDLSRNFNSIVLKVQATVETFCHAQDSLSQLIGNARSASDTINGTAREVATGNDDLASRTAEQAASLEETAASLEEITITVKQTADNARRANVMAASARDVAHNGGQVVAQAVTSMGEINSASRKIAEIVGVIDEIAFQTNLLALNAAVEAARVGEQGKGFAVVAAEVRSLAGRSSTAAKEIKSLVQDSVHKVQEGTELVNQSGEQLHEIVSAVNQVADIVGQISQAAQEQSIGIEQVNKAMSQMDEITQQNAALVEEAAAATQSMSAQAGDLNDLVSQFRVDSNSHVKPSFSVVNGGVSNHSLKATGTDGFGEEWEAPSATSLRMSGNDGLHSNDEF